MGSVNFVDSHAKRLAEILSILKDKKKIQKFEKNSTGVVVVGELHGHYLCGSSRDDIVVVVVVVVASFYHQCFLFSSCCAP